MRVHFDHQVFSLQRHGGITTVFHQLIRYLNRQPEVQADVFLGLSPTRMEFGTGTGRSHVIDFRAVQTRPGYLTYFINEGLTFSSFFRCAYEVYHCTHYRFVPTIRARAFVVTHHDCIPERLPNLFRNRELIMRFKRRSFAKANLILCVSESSRADLIEFYDVPPEKTVVVHNGVLPMAAQQGSRALIDSLVRGDYLLHVGRRSLHKNFNELLWAFAKAGLSKRFTLLAVGGGPPTSAELARVASLKLRNRVKFIPYVSPAQLAACYAHGRLLVYPSLYEGFGMPPLEAASAGCVSLVGANPATLEVCGDCVFFFDPLNRDEFVDMLRLAVDNESERQARLDKTAQTLNKYTWDECGRKTLEAYRLIA